jgi:hypothetical protein
MLREIKSITVKQFLSVYEDTVYTVIQDGFGTYIVLMHDAHGDVKIMHSHLKINEVEDIYNIKL